MAGHLWPEQLNYRSCLKKWLLELTWNPSFLWIKDQKLKESLKGAGSDDEALQDKTVSVVHGFNMFDMTYNNFVAASIEQAKQWTEALMTLSNCLLAMNASPMTFLQKQ